MQSVGSLARLAKTNRPLQERVMGLPINAVEPNPNQVRKEFHYIEELAASIELDGLLQPIVVAEKNRDGKYIIINGERRWRASVHAGMQTIRAILRTPPSEHTRVVLELIENIQRENLSPWEVAGALGKMRSLGSSNELIAAKIGKSKTYVSRHLKLFEQKDVVEELEKHGVNDLNTLCDLVELKKRDRVRFNQIYEQATSRTISRETVREELKKSHHATRGKVQPSGNLNSSTQQAPCLSQQALPAIRVWVNDKQSSYEALLDLTKPASSTNKVFVIVQGNGYVHEVDCCTVTLSQIQRTECKEKQKSR